MCPCATQACGHGFKVVLSELCAGRVRLQARVFGPRRWGIAPMTKPFEILSGADRDHIDADIAVGEKFHHALDDLSVESRHLRRFAFCVFPDKLWANVRSMRGR